MALDATVIIPTFDHGPTIRYPIESVLRQTVQSVEIFVIGDGAPDITGKIVNEIARKDDRVRFFPHPKGPRNGEAYRHEALASAKGRMVAYLADDDFWAPDHLAAHQELLEDADWASTLPVVVPVEKGVQTLLADLSLPYYRQYLQDGSNRVPLGCMSHTLDFYRRLPYGWRAAPKDVWSDLFMMQQMLSVPEARSATGFVPTLFHFPSPWRRGWTSGQRVEELAGWFQRMEDPTQRESVLRALFANAVSQATELESHAKGRSQHTLRARMKRFIRSTDLVGPARRLRRKFRRPE